MGASEVQVWRAFAKINPELRVVGRRPDGYHSIETILQTIDLCDEIRVAPAGDLLFTSSVEPSDESNLVVRAVRAFEACTGVRVRLRIDLRKRIPAAAGLGGGSSDAGVTLMGLDRYFDTRIPGERMQQMLSALGSDVPFFYLGGRALGVGRGDVVFPLPDADRTGTSGWFVLVCPEARIETRDAYSWLTQTTESNTILGFCAHFVSVPESRGPAAGTGRNDFEGPVFGRFPDLVGIRDTLISHGARMAGLSGSGAALFGEFETRAAARRAVAGLGPDYTRFLVRPLSRRDYSRRIFEVGGRRPV